MSTAAHGKIVMRIPRKKFIVIGLLIFIGVIVLLSVIYHQTALWEPEQSFITLLPEIANRLCNTQGIGGVYSDLHPQ